MLPSGKIIVCTGMPGFKIKLNSIQTVLGTTLFAGRKIFWSVYVHSSWFCSIQEQISLLWIWIPCWLKWWRKWGSAEMKVQIQPIQSPRRLLARARPAKKIHRNIKYSSMQVGSYRYCNNFGAFAFWTFPHFRQEGFQFGFN